MSPPPSPGRAVPPPLPEEPAAGTPLTTAVRAAAAGGRLETTLRDVVRAATEHAGARYGALGILTPDGRRLDGLVAVGTTGADTERLRYVLSSREILGRLLGRSEALRIDDLDTVPATVGIAPGPPFTGSFLGVPVRVGKAVFGHLCLSGKRGNGGFTAADEEVVLALAAAAGLAIENARLAEAEQRQRSWAQAAASVATSLLSGIDPDLALPEVAEKVAELAAADACAVLIPLDDDGIEFTVAAATGGDGADAEGVRLPLGGSWLQQAHRTGEALLLDDIPTTGDTRPYAPVVEEYIADGYGPVLVVPLPGHPVPSTLVAVRRKERPVFDADTLELASGFASRVGVALELARSRARQADLEVAADRDRIARDLHDHVVQRIYATGLALDRISRSLAADAPDAAARIAERVDELDATIARIRTAIFELHEPGTGSPATVRTRLAEVVRSVTGGHGLRVDLRMRDGSEELPAGLVHDVVAAVRELLTNVVRHAGASRVTVEVLVDSDVLVVVTDDGRGMPPVTARSGLANLADRAGRRGGRMSVIAGPPGTAVRWTVPLRQDQRT